MRVYLASSLSLLRAALDSGEVVAATGYAVTPALREWYVEGDLEELEYAAAAAAARASLRLVGARDDEPRRVVLAAEVADADARPSPGDERAAVRLAGPVPLRVVESALVDDASAAADVRRGIEALPAADQGDDDAAFAVGSVEDHELAWYAAQELAALVALEA